MSTRITFLLPGAIALALSGCGDNAQLPEQATVGGSPTLPAPNQTWIPTVNVAPAKGWPEGVKPKAVDDLDINAFATGLDHPRWLYVLPNGDVLVAETNAPPRPEEGKGLKGMAVQHLHEARRRGRAKRQSHHAAA